MDNIVSRPSIFLTAHMNYANRHGYSSEIYEMCLTEDYDILVSNECRKYPALKYCGHLGRKLKRPADTKFDKYFDLRKESFETYYSENYRAISQLFPEDGEYYYEDSGDRIHLYAFDKKNFIHITFGRDGDDFEFNLEHNNPNSSDRRYFRYKEKVSQSMVKQAYMLMLEFFFDYDSISQYQDELWMQLDFLVHKGEAVRGLTINVGKYFDTLKADLRAYKRRTENKLIEEDGTPEERAFQRGQLKGVEYCLRLIDRQREK